MSVVLGHVLRGPLLHQAAAHQPYSQARQEHADVREEHADPVLGVRPDYASGHHGRHMTHNILLMTAVLFKQINLEGQHTSKLNLTRDIVKNIVGWFHYFVHWLAMNMS